MVVSQALLANISAALDADPFADPVSVIGIPISRKEARRIGRELTAKFSPAVPDGRTPAVASHNASIGTPESPSAPNREALSGLVSTHAHGSAI